MPDTTALVNSTWNIDPAHTTIGFTVKHMMFTTVRGRFKDFKAVVRAGASAADSSVEAEIQAASIDTGVADRDNHLRSADFLDVEHHPTLTFRSKRVEGTPAKEGDAFRVSGDLTIRGVTREVTLDCVFEGSGTDPWGGTRAGVRATTGIDRHDWGLGWNQVLETGGVLVGAHVRIEIEAQAVKA